MLHPQHQRQAPGRSRVTDQVISCPEYRIELSIQRCHHLAATTFGARSIYWRRLRCMALLGRAAIHGKHTLPLQNTFEFRERLIDRITSKGDVLKACDVRELFGSFLPKHDGS